MQVQILKKISLSLGLLLLAVPMSQAAMSSSLTPLVMEQADPSQNIFARDYNLQEQASAESPYFNCGILSSMTASPIAFLATCTKETFEQTNGEFERQIGMIAPIVLTLEILENNISHIEIQNRLTREGDINTFIGELLEKYAYKYTYNSWQKIRQRPSLMAKFCLLLVKKILCDHLHYETKLVELLLELLNERKIPETYQDLKDESELRQWEEL